MMMVSLNYMVLIGLGSLRMLLEEGGDDDIFKLNGLVNDCANMSGSNMTSIMMTASATRRKQNCANIPMEQLSWKVCDSYRPR